MNTGNKDRNHGKPFSFVLPIDFFTARLKGEIHFLNWSAAKYRKGYATLYILPNKAFIH